MINHTGRSMAQSVNRKLLMPAMMTQNGTSSLVAKGAASSPRRATHARVRSIGFAFCGRWTWRRRVSHCGCCYRGTGVSCPLIVNIHPTLGVASAAILKPVRATPLVVIGVPRSSSFSCRHSSSVPCRTGRAVRMGNTQCAVKRVPRKSGLPRHTGTCRYSQPGEDA